MKTRRDLAEQVFRFIFAVAATVVVLGSTSGCYTHAPLPEEAEPVLREIPLESIFSTCGPKGTKYVDRRLDEPGGPELQALFRHFRDREICDAPSNLFLVRGQGIAEAMKATYFALNDERSADQVVGAGEQALAQELWLAVYFGVDPAEWQMESVTQKGQTVRVAVRKPQPAQCHLMSIHQCFLWVPLGKLPQGDYSLELFDTAKNAVTLSRSVVVADR